MTRKRKATKAVKARKPSPRRSPLEDDLAKQIKDAGLDKPEREYKFHSTRRWRFDFAWPDSMVAVEVEGAIFTGGRHSRGTGMLKDMEKYNTAATLGWTVLRVAKPHLESGEAIRWIEEML